MTLYLSIILIAMAIIISFNTLNNSMVLGFSPFWVMCVVTLGVVVEIAIDGLFAFIIQSLPDRWFNKDKKIFNVSRKERKFYEKLKIKNWKDKIFEFGAMGKFRKNKIYEPNNPKYIERFIIDSNKGFLIHIADIVFGFLILLFPLPKYWFCIGLPIALVNAFLNLLPIMVLRYNIPKLKVALLRASKTFNVSSIAECLTSAKSEEKEESARKVI